MIIKPNSKTLLAIPFYWDPMTFESLDDSYRADDGSQKITATFVAEQHPWNDNLLFEIR